MNIDVVYITDENYTFLTKISILSIIKNRSKSTSYSIFIIAADLQEKSIQYLEELNQDGVKISVITKSVLTNQDFAKHLYVSSAALFKFLLPEIFLNLEKILYIDSDTIILKDLAEFFNTDITDCYAAVVSDMIVVKNDHWNETLGLENYFNSGVMLLNLEKLRQDAISEKLFEYKKNDINRKFMDQDALNVVFGKKVKLCEPKFNFMCTNESFFSKQELKEYFGTNCAIYDATIIHYTGPNKPIYDVSQEIFALIAEYVDPKDFLIFFQKYMKIFKEEQEKIKENLEQNERQLADLRSKTDSLINSKPWRAYKKACTLLRKLAHTDNRNNNVNRGGDKTDWHYCPFCKKKTKFIDFGTDAEIFKKKKIIGGGYRKNVCCNECMANDRIRWVDCVIEKHTQIYKGKGRMLHIAPEKAIEAKIRQNKNLEYITGDIVPGVAERVVDITKMQFQNNYFDYILLNHVLEHIPCEEKAVLELKRCLKPHGQILFSMPICVGKNTFEDTSINTDADRLRQYGQQDHVRLYGEDIIKRMEKYGLKVKEYKVCQELSRHEIKCLRLISQDRIYIASVM